MKLNLIAAFAALFIFFSETAFAQQGMGVGNANPQEMLDVTGAIKIGTDINNTNAAPSGGAGTIRFRTGQFEGWDGAAWIPLGGGGGFSPFLVDNNLVQPDNTLVDLATDDFIFGSPSLDDNTNTDNDARFFFDKSKGAFRAGSVAGDQWDDVKRGNQSFAAGFDVTASGDYAISLGERSRSTGIAAISLGTKAYAYGDHSFAWGYDVEASGEGAITLGRLSVASANYSYAIGSNVNATGEYSLAFGAYANATNDYAFALGSQVTASGSSAFVLGLESSATGVQSSALGYNVVSSGGYSVSFGHDLTSLSGYEVVMGRYNATYVPTSTNSWEPTDRLFSIGNGSSSVNRSNALTILKNGNTGLGTTTPSATLHVDGSLRYEDGNQQAGYIPVSNNNGTMVWTDPTTITTAADGDGDASNELQTLTQSGTDVTLSDGGGTISVADNDNDASNELQTLSVSGADVTLSNGGGTVTVIDGDWTINGNNQYSAVSGNVGVGMLNPASKLHIEGTTQDETGGFRFTSPGGTGVMYLNSTNDIVLRKLNQTDQLVLDAGGNVGVGTNAPGDELHVEGSIRMVDGNQQAGFIPVSNNNGTMVWTDPATITTQDDGDWTISGNDQYSAVLGKVGIGTTTPDNKLQVVGSAAIGADTHTNTGPNSLVVGTNISNTGRNSIIGGNSHTVTGTHVLVSGYDHTVAADNSVVLNNDNSNTAAATNSLVGGYNSSVSGQYALSFGWNSQASGVASTSLGYSNQATGAYSFAGNTTNVVSGNRATGFGNNNRARSYGEFVVGSFNTDYTPVSATAINANDRVFTVGNGISDVIRSNAMVILKNGNTGIGVSTPLDKLHVDGNIRMVDGNQLAGRIPVSDANGTMVWTDPTTITTAADGDGDASNELQTLSQSGTDVTLSDGGGTISVADNDNDASNELQTLSVSGADVTLSNGGGTVTVDDGDWTFNGNDIHNANTGNVGIGVAAANAKLEVSGAESATHGTGAAIRISNSAAGGDAWLLRTGATGTQTPAGGFSIAHASGYRMVINSSGDVGFGTTTPDTKLHVSSSTTGEATGFKLTQDVANSLMYHNADNDLVIRKAAQTDQLVLDNGGNIGVGTATPGDKLHVEGSIRMVDGNQQAGYIPVATTNGTMVWTDPSTITTAADGDGDASNELQTLTQSGTDVTLSNGGGTISVADNDNDASNELQALSISGNDITLSNGGGTVSVPNDADWVVVGNDQHSAVTGRVGIGTTSPDNKLQVVGNAVIGGDGQTNTGTNSLMVGVGNSNTGQNSIIGGNNMTVTGTHALTSGYLNTVAANNSVAIGSRSNIVSGANYSLAGGYNSEISGQYGLAFGLDNVTSGEAAMAFGRANTSSGDYSFTGNASNTANGLRAAAFGQDNQAGANQAFAVGFSQQVYGENAFAAGADSYILGKNAAGIGHRLFAPSFCEIAVGNFNTNYTANNATGFDAADRAFVVGNGASGSNRSNAMTILKNGNIGIGQDVPEDDLHVEGSIRMVDGNQGEGKVAVSDANGTMTWTDRSNFIAYHKQAGVITVTNGSSTAYQNIAGLTSTTLDVQSGDVITLRAEAIVRCTSGSGNDDFYMRVTYGNCATGNSEEKVIRFDEDGGHDNATTLNYLDVITAPCTGTLWFRFQIKHVGDDPWEAVDGVLIAERY